MADDTTTREERWYLLTTVDNPFDPFTEFKQWWAFDERNGYNTPGLLDRLVGDVSELSEADQHQIVQDAIDEVVRLNVSGMHRKVSRESFERTPSS